MTSRSQIPRRRLAQGRDTQSVLPASKVRIGAKNALDISFCGAPEVEALRPAAGEANLLRVLDVTLWISRMALAAARWVQE